MALSDLLPASFRGVPFAVREDDFAGGRRVAMHLYPGRDDPWAEDMGRAPRQFSLRGFILEDDAIYGGGPISLQRTALKAALEAAGSGLLTHPSFGVLTVNVLRFSIGQQITASRMSTIEIDVVEAGQQQFPSLIGITNSGVLSAVEGVASALSGNFTGALVGLTSGALLNLPAVLPQWASQVVSLALDATSLLNLAAQLPGNNGRYSAGANAGFASQNASPYPVGTTVADLVPAASAERASVAAQATALETAIAGFGTTIQAEDVPALVAALIATLSSVCADPADALRLLGDLAGFVPVGIEALSVPGAAMSDLFRRTAVCEIVKAASSYQPASYDDAFATLQAVTAFTDAEITSAGDAGLDDLFEALEVMRAQIVEDLQARGAALAPITLFELPAPIPALALAQRFYRDGGRADELVTQVQVPNPLFMPTAFRALAA